MAIAYYGPSGQVSYKLVLLLYVMLHGYTFRDSNTVIFIFVSLHYWCSPPKTESTCKGKTLLSKLQDLSLIVHLVGSVITFLGVNAGSIESFSLF